MKSILSRFFGKREKTSAPLPGQERQAEVARPFTLQSTPEEAKTHAQGLREAYIRTVEKSPDIKPEMREEVVAHLTREGKDLIREGDFLNAEKKSLGYNPRSKITREGLAVLTQEAIRAGLTPRQVLREIYICAKQDYSLKSSMDKMRKINIKRYSVMIANTGLECEWCKSMDKEELDIMQDFYEMAKQNCGGGSGCTCILQPVLEWGD